MPLADLDHVEGPRESRLVGIRWVAAGDDHAARGIEPALGVVVHVLAAHPYSFLSLQPVLLRGSDTRVHHAFIPP